MSENNTPSRKRLDSGGLLYMLGRVKTIFTGMFVGKENGKGLSTNDYTNEEKTKLAGIAAGAEVNTPVDSSLSGSSTNPVQNKAVKGALDLKAPLESPAFTGTPTVPTAATNTNTTQAASTAFVKNAIASALSGQLELHFSFLQELPESGVEGTFYFIPAEESVTGVDEWEEYVWNSTDSQFERVGAATLDITDYFNTANLPAITNAQIDTILASQET